MKNELEIKLDNKAQEVIGEVAKEHGGGGATYTAGNGITITNENVINADVKAIRLQWSGGQRPVLTNEQCEALKIGDTVTYKQNDIQHTETSYTVSYKNDSFMFITYLSTYSVWCEAYIKVGGVWQYSQEMSEEKTQRFAKDIPFVYLDESGGSIEEIDYNNILEKGCCYIVDNDEVSRLAMISDSSGDFDGDHIPTLSTTVYQGKYYTVTFEPVEPQDPEEEWTFNYTVNEETVGGGSLGHTLSIKNMANNLDLEIGLLQYTELGLEVVDETISGDNEFHTFNNVFAFLYLSYDGYDHQIGNATGVTMGCIIIDSLEQYDEAQQLLTNVEMTVITPLN